MRKLLMALLAGALFCLGGCAAKENPWIPRVQGSCVRKLNLDRVIDGEYVVEKYADFKSFKRSELANYNFISAKPAKEERYSEEFFRTRDLVAVMFRRPDDGTNYTVTDVSGEGNDRVITLLPMAHRDEGDLESEPVMVTYCCFLETEYDVSDWNVRLEFEDRVEYEGFAFSYLDKYNRPYIFPDEDAPVIFRINAKAGTEEFIENDPILEPYDRIRLVLHRYPEEEFDESDLLLIRVPSSELETCAVCRNGDSIGIVGVWTNHYMYSRKKYAEHSKLIMLFVPKGFVPENVVWTRYNEYEDGGENGARRRVFSPTGFENITDNLTRIDLK